MILKMDTFILKIDALSFWYDWAQLKKEARKTVNIY